MGAFDRIAETARDAKERVGELADRVIDKVKEATGQGQGEAQQARGRGNGGDRGDAAREVKGDKEKDREKDRDKLGEQAGVVLSDIRALGEQARQAVMGPPNVLDILHRDHEVVSGLFDQLDALKEQRSELRESLFSQLKYELGTHALAEEAVFYPAIREANEARGLVLEAFEEHRVAKQLLTELAGMAIGPEWEAKLVVLREAIQHHVREEEGAIFNAARSVMNKDELSRLGQRFEQEKQRLAAAGRPNEADDLASLEGVSQTMQ